jgi:hypothetical protein
MERAGHRNCGLWIAECGLKNKGPKESEISNSKSEMERPMLFACNALAPGPRLKHPGNVNPQ